jgi:UDP-N-acetylmuramyl tripeptide synthase
VYAIQPKYSLILNVLRDQLDRFGEIDYTTNLLRTIVEQTTTAVVLNREDRRIADLAKDTRGAEVHYFGLDESLLRVFPSDDNLRGETPKPHAQVPADVTLDSFSDNRASFTLGTTHMEVSLKLNGIYNVYNAAAALAVVRSVLKDTIDIPKLTKALENVTPAFGRGESFTIEQQKLELILVKNPSGFRLGLQSFLSPGVATMIAINDNYADGRDMSWLWDVDFRSLAKEGVSQVSGVRGYDMALRLQYDDVSVDNVETKIGKALKRFISNNSDKPMRIYCTYTAMLEIRRALRKSTYVEHIA